MWLQNEVRLNAKPRGFHLITHEIVQQCPQLNQIEVGMLNLFIKHTSASLSLNENYDPSVRVDFEQFFNRCVSENEPYFTHTDEGADDMPAHLKSSILGASISIPVSNGQLNLGTWQGIYLCEHRNHASGRSIVLTLMGQ